MDIPSTSKSKQDENLEDNCDSDSNESDGTSEKCPICLLALSNGQEVGRPAVCDHIFCFPCISEWSSMVQTCPIDRAAFSTIRVYTDPESEKVLRTVRVEAKKQEDEEIIELIGIEEFTPCEICSRFDHEDRMLLCDGCDKGKLMTTIMNFATKCKRLFLQVFTWTVWIHLCLRSLLMNGFAMTATNQVLKILRTRESSRT